MNGQTKVKNFFFHRVNPVRDELWDPMDVRKFEQCVKYLSKHFVVVSLEEACNTDYKPSATRPLATITFDDGYHDNLEYAAPILQKYNCPASFYIVTDCMDSGRMVWTQEIKHYLQTTKFLKFNADLSYLPASLQVREWKNRNHRIAYARSIRDFLVKANSRVRNYFLDDMRLALNDVTPLNLMMNWEDVRQLNAAGFVIGSHTKTHPALTSLEKVQDIETEFTLSGNRIAEVLGSFPLSIAYPFGAYDGQVAQAAHRCGYKYGITANQQWYFSQKDNIYAISRTGLSNEPWLKMLTRINGSIEQCKDILKVGRYRSKSLSIAGHVLASAGVIASESAFLSDLIEAS